jgi:cytochrome c oxidase subunit 2
MSDFSLLPPRASDLAHEVDHLFFALTGITGAVAVAITLLIIVFCVKYRRGSNADRSHPPAGYRPLEIGWIVTPLVIFLGIFLWAAKVYSRMHDAPADALQVFVVAKQWMWKAEHDNGRREIDELHLPLGRPVQLLMTSQDVIHSFYVPAFRVKQDVLPGRYESLWFTPTQTGEFHLLCAEYCGGEHSRMRGRIVVMQPADYARWLEAGSAAPSMAQRGEALFRQYGCSGCHDTPSTVHAPSLAGLYGKPVHLRDGRTVIADDGYLRDSILQANKDIVAGYANDMPIFQGQIGEEDVLQLLAYIKSLGSAR